MITKYSNYGSYFIYKAEDAILTGTEIVSSIQGYSGSGYADKLTKEEANISVIAEFNTDGYYDISISYISPDGPRKNFLMVDDYFYGEFLTSQCDNFSETVICNCFFKAGKHNVKIQKFHGDIAIDYIKIAKAGAPAPLKSNFSLCNEKASKEARAVMNYLKSIYGKKILTAQHTSAASGPEIDYIYEVTGSLPAIRGFDLLSYSHCTETMDASESIVSEIANNKGTIEEIINWYSKGGIPIICWHWFSPIVGKDRSFYTDLTDFNLNLALTDGTEENKALLADIDEIARQLSILKKANIPVLWRPLHEAEGGWFWWGAKGPEAYKKLYYLIFDRYTKVFDLNNLIWVWNAPKEGWYPGNDFVDIASIDVYAPAGNYGPVKISADYVLDLTDGEKPVALAENGSIPDPDLLIQTETPWLWYMPWWGMHALDGIHNSKEHLKKVYNHPYTIKLKDLPSFK
ncbi:glycosyl hydrolase [Clostridium oryzae]|uniref:glycosyl hydrolase n=1 Tax=Clostridium oryzae TaxID=1450648 RepID=UPI00147291E2|nr:glycosyl hydrolase [Clostridium oryzae]